MGVGRAGEHVAGVALMAGCVGQDVTAGVGREEPVCHIDGDALLTLGTQPVGQRGQVGDALFVGDGLEVVERQAVGVMQEPPDKCALTVVDRSGGGDPEKLARHQKYPSRLRSSMAAADVRSSARVSPRSETVAAEISAITRSISVA